MGEGDMRFFVLAALLAIWTDNGSDSCSLMNKAR